MGIGDAWGGHPKPKKAPTKGYMLLKDGVNCPLHGENHAKLYVKEVGSGRRVVCPKTGSYWDL